MVKFRFFKKIYVYDYETNIEPLTWLGGIKKNTSYLGKFEFCFLNITHKFEDKIDWNYDSYGKLWTYNLNYFDFLNQSYIKHSEALMLMYNYVESTQELNDGIEPYPISLRCINWIKYLSKENIKDNAINKSLYNQYLRLLDSLEYHILGNHLLENGLSLLFGAYYFKNDVFYAKAKYIIECELEEQINNDGGHFELSPMYHQIILDRLLDCISLVKENPWKENFELLTLMKFKATEMLSWLTEVTFKDDTIPMVNDSAFGIAPNTSSLVKYGKELKIFPLKTQLSDSGYRKFTSDSYELFADVGEVGPTYQPGHAHADTFSFILQTNKPFIIDTGLSTYNMGEVREKERSTLYHNTVTINDENSSKVWAGFRVANRANVTIEKDEKNELIASHNGYKSKGVKHKRSFGIGVSEVLINDFINKDIEAQAHFHFHPDCKLEVNLSKCEVKADGITVTFFGSNHIKQNTYQYALGYNNRLEADKITVTFRNSLETKIKIEV
ncbi:alginate lyase family protein [Polaribacter sp. Hel_I_88]|uniref:alginate lyase family protein n=1 Tax=Polaribacter sp. Hel_I_88 TaxID=1250006 RepID=UPI00068D5328|nr:alginate lyase family protein [Polaribacter sp. Hel_I_88]